MATYDRYSNFRVNGECRVVPFIEITPKASDFFETYKKNVTRLDILSYEYYGDANYAWLIMQANPEYGSMEYEIPDAVTLRIPYPLNETLTKYNEAVAQYYELY